ncbi:MAG: NAD(P)-binding domain-containing protein [Anaerolineales bacterium]|nr:NAD(P)-binding domain-containing protein [Anaerolineales bacterium]
MSHRERRFAVIGAGHGGKSMAAHIALMGYPVALYNRTPEHIAAIKLRGGIELESCEGGPRGFARLDLVTADVGEALAQAEVIMVVIPSTGHADVARIVAPHLGDGQVIVLNPGRTGGAFEFVHTLARCECRADVTVAEAETLLYASRSEGPAQARIFRIKEAVPIAALPASRTEQVLELLAPAFPQFIDGQSVLHTSLNNMGAIFHPALTLLNAGRIESTGGAFQFYVEGATRSVACVLETLDRERVTVAAALGIRAQTGLEWLRKAYDATGEDLYEAIQNQPGYRGITAPSTLNHRYITEDVPMSLVPIAALGQRYGVSVAGIDSIIRLACVVHRTDYWRRGRTLDKLGIDQLSVHEVMRFAMEGVR